MSVYAVERVRQIMDGYVNQTLAPLVMNTEATERVESWLEDEASRQSYRRELAFMALRNLVRDDGLVNALTGNIKYADWQQTLATVSERRSAGSLPEIEYPPSPEWVLPDMFASTYVMEQYANGSVRPVGVFLDCGACCGETAVWALEAGAERVYSFEPNPVSFEYLLRNVKTFGKGRIIPVQRGLGDAPALLPMRQGMGSPGEAHFDPTATGGTAVPIVTLDGWCRENAVRPDFIKMDLEGWEMAALRGGRGIIADCRPRLAVCLYHNLSDMWTIPHLLKEICPSYRFWCRKTRCTWNLCCMRRDALKPDFRRT